MKEKDLSNLSHENEVNENLETPESGSDSHESESVEEKATDDQPVIMGTTESEIEPIEVKEAEVKSEEAHTVADAVEEIPVAKVEESVVEETKEDDVAVAETSEEKVDVKSEEAHTVADAVEEIPVAKVEESVVEETKTDDVTVAETSEEKVDVKSEEALTVADAVEEITVAKVEESVAEETKVDHVTVAETSEEKVDVKVEEETVVVELQTEPDYMVMEKSELVDRLTLLLENKPSKGIKDRLDAIKHNFYKKHNEEVAEAKKKFLEDEGKEEEFDFGKDDLELKMKALLFKYRESRIVHTRNLEQEKDDNLKTKYQIIEDIKDLVNRKEAFDKTFHEFRDLQKKWHETGMVPQAALKNLWDNYHHHVENFYDYIKINKELRDLDLKKNLAAKIHLCEETEKLLEDPTVVKAFNTLQKYHEQWREIGPVPREQKDEIWERFKATTTTINRSHQEFYEGLKSEQKINLEKKEVLCDKVEVIANSEIESHKDWNTSSKEILDLQKEWRTIGFAPKKDNNRIYQRFRAACDMYFDKKRKFYLKLKDKLGENLVKKTDLCERAETLQDSTNWKETTDKLIAIQKEWKTVGPVPRKISEELWVRFRAACDKFFSGKSKHFDHVDTDHVENLKLKEEVIRKIHNFELADNDDENLSILRGFQKEWTQIGHVPFKKKDRIQDEFRRALNTVYDKLDLETGDKEVQKFQSKIDNFLNMNHSEDKIIVERNKIAGKIRQLETDIGLWENNIGFFSASKTSGLIVKEIEEKIENGKQSLKLLQEKLKVIDGLVS
ncbi:MAG: DUF349 domain-containing protein [Labilibaculum sp.]|nr:DUF349 domain-containing protein [Labilibaculum sp.]